MIPCFRGDCVYQRRQFFRRDKGSEINWNIDPAEIEKIKTCHRLVNVITSRCHVMTRRTWRFTIQDFSSARANVVPLLPSDDSLCRDSIVTIRFDSILQGGRGGETRNARQWRDVNCACIFHVECGNYVQAVRFPLRQQQAELTFRGSLMKLRVGGSSGKILADPTMLKTVTLSLFLFSCLNFAFSIEAHTGGSILQRSNGGWFPRFCFLPGVESKFAASPATRTGRHDTCAN